MTLRLFLILTILGVTTNGSAQKRLNDFGKLRDLDLLFVVSQQSNSITEVTSGINGYPIDHVAILRKENGEMKVVEAVYEGVHEITLDEFIKTAPMILVGRPTKRLDKKRTIDKIMEMIGRPYDFVYKSGNNEIYCSELVADCYVDNHGIKMFTSIPMSFHNENGNITPYWDDFFSRRGMEVPEGKPGTNPGELSRHPTVKIKYLIRDFFR